MCDSINLRRNFGRPKKIMLIFIFKRELMESQEKIFNFFGINILRMQKFKGL